MLDVWPCIRPSMNSCLCIASYAFLQVFFFLDLVQQQQFKVMVMEQQPYIFLLILPWDEMRWGLFSSRSRCSSSIWFDVIGFSFLMPLCLHCRLCWSVFNSSCCCCYCYMRTLFNSASVAAAAASTSIRAPTPRAVTRPPASASVSSPSSVLDL